MRSTPWLALLLTLGACGDDGETSDTDTVIVVDVTGDVANDTVGDTTTTTDTTATTDTLGPDAGTTQLTVTATVPPETPAAGAIFLVAGELELELTDVDATQLTGALAVPTGDAFWIELRVAGAAALVGLDAAGQRIERTTIGAGLTAGIPVERWGPPEGVTANEVAFIVTIPAASDTTTGIWVSGNAPVLGDWSGAGLRLHATRDGRWAGVAAFAADFALEYKVTRGSWETVEKDASGGEIANRMLTVTAPITRPEITALRWADGSGGTPTGTGDIELIPDVASAHLDPDRDIIVWLPPGYDTETTRRYPVLYMHDGQNLMDAATSAFGTEWGVDEAAQALVTAGEIEPLIIVGVNNTGDRISEYTPTVDAEYGDGGDADLYGRFLAEELKPMIDERFRTQTAAASTGLAGSSLGGLVSMYLGLERSATFTRLGVVSPSVWWDDLDIVDRVNAIAAKLPLRIWLDIGTAEGGGESVEDTRLLRDALVAKGWVVGTDLAYTEVQGGEHNEASWAARMDDILRWLYPPQ